MFVLAGDNKVGYSREYSRLTEHERTRISQAIARSPQSSSDRSSSNRRQTSRILQIRTKLGLFREPYLDQAVFSEAKLAAETAYPYLYIFENSIRNFIDKVLSKASNKDWWASQMKTKTLREIKQNAESRMSDEKRQSFHRKRGAHQLFYTDFKDLIDIMANHETVFNPYFGNLTGKLKAILYKLREIEPSRNVTAHSNPLSKRDLQRVEGYLGDWLAQLAYIKQEGLL